MKMKGVNVNLRDIHFSSIFGRYAGNPFYDFLPKYLTKNPLKKKVIERFLTKIVTIVRQMNPQTILDIGCGNGVPLFYLNRYVPHNQIVGLDTSRKELEIAKGINKEADFVVADINTLPFREEIFDLVLCLEVLEHLKDTTKALSSLHKVGRKTVVISVPDSSFFNIMSLFSLRNIRNLGEDKIHLHNFNKTRLTKLLKEEFQHFEITKTLPWLIAVCDFREGFMEL